MISKLGPSEPGALTVRDVLQIRPALLMLIVSVAGLIAAYTPVFGFWWKKWFEPNSYYSHGPLVVLAAAAIIVMSRGKAAEMPLRPSAIGFALMVPAAIVGLMGRMTATTSVMGLMLPLYVLGAIVAVLGYPAARLLRFPVLFLFFAGALPESLTETLSFRLQMASMGGSVWLLNVLGFDAVAHGSRIDLMNTWVQVAEGCSGFRLTISLVALAVFLAYIRRISAWRKAVVVAAAVPFGVVLNVFRVTSISAVCDLTSRQVSQGLHDWTGWLVMLLAAGLLFLISRPVSKRRPVPEPALMYESTEAQVAVADYGSNEEGEPVMEKDQSNVLEATRDQLPPLRTEEQAREAFEKTMEAQRQLENAAQEVKEMERALANAHNAVAEARRSFTDARSVLMEHLGMRDTEVLTAQEPQPASNWERNEQ